MAKFIKGCFTLVGGFFVLVFILAVIGNMGRQNGQTRNNSTSTNQAPAQQAAKAPEPPAPVATVNVSEILKSYENNKIKAEQTYKGKRLRIKGVVASIGSDVLDLPYVTIGTGASFEVPQIQCYFPKENAGQLANLDKGQSLTVEGTVDDYVMNVMVQDCRLGGK